MEGTPKSKNIEDNSLVHMTPSFEKENKEA
jgi:hypothetical protein